MRLSIVDVFAERAYEGNQLAVVHDAAALESAQMQEIAREMNFSETTFVISATDESASVRIFTPFEELPFAGHPTLGTAWVLGHARGAYQLRLAAGDVNVRFDAGLAWMVPPEPQLRETISAGEAAQLAGAGIELDSQWPARRVYSGLEYCLVPLASLDALRRLRPDISRLQAFSRGAALFTVCRGSYSPDAQVAARMHFFDGVGMREDPATGSANAAFAAYLRDLGLSGSFVVEQGFEVLRPSRIYLDVGPTLRVGGRVQPVAEGTLFGR